MFNYGNPYGNNSPYSAGYAQNYASQMQRQEIVKVNGQNGAMAYNMAPNSSALLLDEVEPIVWLKTTDGAGYPSVKPYKITPYEAEPQPDLKLMESRIAKLEELINESNTTSARHKKNEQSE